MLNQNIKFAIPFCLSWINMGGVICSHGANPLNETLASIQEKAVGGDAHYQGSLALFHKHGEFGLTVDLEEAERWARMSSEKKGALGLATLAAIEMEKGNVAKGRFLYDEAYLHTNLRKLVNSNDPLALFCLGMMEIDNPPVNFPKALRHLGDAAKKGFATAQATLGMIYFTGIGTAKNSTLAINWCSKAAKSKLPLGMFYLGMAYSVGDGLPMNDEIAMRWIYAAATRELSMAQLVLGMKLAQGDGISKNLPLAVQWLRRASRKGSAEASLQLRRYENILARSGDAPKSYQNPSIETSFSQKITNQISNPNKDINNTSVNRKNEFENLPIKDDDDFVLDENMFEQPESESETLLKIGLDNYKISKYEDAKFYFIKSASLNNHKAYRYLGIIYFLGQGVKIDYEKSAHHFKKAQELGDLESSRYLRILKQFK